MKKITLLGVLLLSLLFAVNTGQAGYEPISRNVCALAVHPYNALAEGANILDPTKSSAWQNIFKQGTPECDNHVIYPNPYTPYPVTEQAAPPLAWPWDTSKSIPETIHLHKYFNDSIQDSKYYKSFTDSFQIYLEVDALENSDLSKLVCYTPGENNTVRTTPGCNGTLTDWGGTEITFNSTTGLINWKFATSGSGRPRLYGINPGLHGKTGVLNTNNENNRKLEFGVKLVSKNNANKKIWSATTTSRTLVRDQGINTANANAVTNPDDIPACTGDGTTLSTYDYSKWCTLPDSAIEASTKIEQKNVVGYNANGKTYITNGKFYYWKQIGPVATIWRNVTPPPPSLLGCADLQWDGAFKKNGPMGIYYYDTINPNALLPDQKAIMKFKTIYDSGSGEKRPLEYRWVAFYGDQNRPGWFKNDDSLGAIWEAIQNAGPSLQPMLLNSLPGRLLRVAHAAPSPGPSASLSSSVQPSAVELPTAGSLITTGGSSASLSPTATSALKAETSPMLDAFVMLGSFKDEISSVLSGNPLTDDDNQVFYSGGSEGVTLGVQAFYSDGKNLAGFGPMVTTPDGQRQKANTCHLELVIQPTPVTCIDLDISPKTLEPNTPVTFTVTPKFQPSNKTILLNYRWSAEKKPNYLSGIGLSYNPSVIIGATQYLPGATLKEKEETSWVGSGIAEVIGVSTEIIGVNTTYCPGGNCFQPEQTVVPFDPTGPVINPVNQGSLGQGGVLGEGAFSSQMLGANVFADFGKAAVLDSTSNITSSVISSTKPTGGIAVTDYAVPMGLTYGGFKDSQTATGFPLNPFLETTDKKTWYSGGPANTLIKVQAEGKDGTVYPACKNGLVIPEVPGEAECELLKVKFYSGDLAVDKDALVAGTTYHVEIDQANSVNTDGSPIEKFTLATYNPKGVGTLIADPDNAAGCAPVVNLPVINPSANIQARGTQGSTPVSCKYLYTPNAEDKITLLADPHDNVAACRVDAAVPDVPTEPICKALNLTTTPAISGNTINQGQLVALNTNPVDTDDQPRPPVVYSETGNGNFVANAATNAATCPAVPASGTFEADPACKYSYQAPNDNTAASVTIKVKDDNGVAECSRTFTIPSIPDSKELCLALNLRVNGQYTLAPQILPGQSYALQVSPVTTKGNTITMVSWTESGDGRLVGEPGNPAICPALIDNGTVVTLSVCRYIFASPPNAQNIGFAVRAVPDDGVANCIAAAANYTPPEEDEEPFCLYLDLDYTPEPFNPLTASQMNATVVMSDGSQYSTQPGGLNRVRFTATNGNGNFNGGFGQTTGGGTADFRTQTDNTNNTRTVNYQNGTAQSGINVFLSDTSVKMSAACQRQLRPQPKDDKDEGCELPPVIRDKGGNRYCAEDGVGTDQYCWEIEGPGDLIFTNNSRFATGDCVTLDENYEEFRLTVEDCDPLYRDICWDRISKTVDDDEDEPGKPSITKRISKSTPLRYTVAAHFSTTGASGPAVQSETVKYKLEYVPANFEEAGDRTMTARIYDPAFSGAIRGLKIHIDGTMSELGGTIEFDVPQDFSIVKPSGYVLCNDSSSAIDKCYRIEKAGSENSYMEIRGISSDDPIVIEYNGLLKSGITLEDCREGVWCNEEFKNQSTVDTMEYCEETTDKNGNKTELCTTISNNEVPNITSNTVIADVVCQYFLTRASGDVFLEDDLVYGLDVSKCYPFKNISSTIVKPIDEIEQVLIKTGLESSKVISISHEICSSGQADFANLQLTEDQRKALTTLFGSAISENLSSQICEVGLVPGSAWDKTSIAAAMSRNIGRLTRWSTGVNPAKTIGSFTELQQESPGKVYYYLGNGNETVTIDGLRIPEGEGAYTIIVENADLQINGNIEYTSGVPAISADQIASLGVIVLDGNMYINPEVEKLAGAYFVQRSVSTDLTKGNVFSGTLANPNVNSYKMLTVNGSIYGNIGPLFTNRIAAGDITKDEGAITIRYDQRIIQNPPAGLTDLLGDFSQTQVAR